ncbi:MAG: peptide chain release factor N(5)-glutamine methyltransferase, partial [Burkholderiales bacterium]|nr:peptide chain release factor N(5)-glutamine methyltransferase [Burkholderiales bacterium]
MSSVIVPSSEAFSRDVIRLRGALGLSNRDARSEVELLLMRALNISRARLIAHPQLAAAAQYNEMYRSALERRLAGEPMAYILGEREFYGHVLSVSPEVLIPRPETELLVDMALARLDPDKPARLLDLGTGSGAIAIAIALQRPNVEVTAVDVSPACLDIAKGNCERLTGDGERIHWLLSDWYDQLGGTRFDVIVSNPPYIAEGDDHLRSGDIRFEPRTALVSGAKGLDALQAIIGLAPEYLAEGGWLLCEHGYDQSGPVRQMLTHAAFPELVAERDLAGVLRVSGGCWLTVAA